MTKNRRFYQLFCEICNWKMITNGDDIESLVEVQTSPVPGGIPKIDPNTKKIIESKSINQTRKFKCPQCGRLVMPKRLLPPKKESEDEEEDRVDGS